MNMTDMFGLTDFTRHADGDCDGRLVRCCNRLTEAEHQLGIAIRAGNEDLEAKIRIYVRRHVEIAIGTPAETVVGMAAKGSILRMTNDHKELLAESLANDALGIYNLAYKKRFSAPEIDREMRESPEQP